VEYVLWIKRARAILSGIYLYALACRLIPHRIAQGNPLSSTASLPDKAGVFVPPTFVLL
jgi:hypothetical protein